MATVLVVDDRLENREFLTTLLSYRDHRILEASDGAEALEVVRAHRPELVIADVLMPTMDGYEFVRQLRNDPEVAQTPVIFYTASYHEREARTLAESCGVRHLIVKPAEPEQILATVDQALGAAVEPEKVSPPEEFDREHLRLLTDKLVANVNAQEAANQRLREVLDLGHRLASELNGLRLLQNFCSSVRELMGARFSFVGLLAEGQVVLQPFFISGADAETATHMRGPSPYLGLLGRLISESGPLRVRDAGVDPITAGLPAGYHAYQPFLGARLSSPTRTYGLVWVLGKLGGEEFSEEDGRVLVTLSAQAGVAYENARRYEQIQGHARELERSVEERTAQLTAANQELESFSYSVSHDLRSPLRHVEGFANILLTDFCAQLNPEAQDHLQRIRAAALDMSQLVDDLLRLSRIGRQDLRKRRVELNEMLDAILDEIKPETSGRDITWRIGRLPSVECDAGLMRRVLANLLSNAVKYTRLREHAVIEVDVTSMDGRPTVFVRDNGVGFNMKYADRLFGVFQRLHRKEDFEGTGIGLAIVQRIIQKHGGRVWAEAELEGGATFYFTLPSMEEKQARLPPSPAPATNHPPAGYQM